MKLPGREFSCPSRGSLFERDVASTLFTMKEEERGLCPWNAGEAPWE